MNKSELCAAISSGSGVSQSDVDKVLKGLEATVTSAVCGGGDKIVLSGFLSFERGHRAARAGRNPQTGETIQIAAANTIKISAGSKLKAAAKASTSAY